MVVLLLSFKGITHAYLLQISVTHNKKLLPLLSLFINYISVRSALQILSIKDECVFRFSNVLIIDLCNNSSANSWFDTILLLIAQP